METFLKAITAYLEKSKLWPKVQPGFALFTLYVAAAVFGYEYIRWAYAFTPSLPLYLRSYVFRGITVLFVGVALLLALFALIDRLTRPPASAAEPPKETREEALLRKRRRLAAGLRWTAVAVVMLACALLVRALLPRPASHVRVRFLERPAEYQALVYAIYELNRMQPHWQFDVDFAPVKLGTLTSKELGECGDDLLCQVTAAIERDGDPTVVITSREIKNYAYWKRQGGVALVTTHGRGGYDTLTEVEYLAYCLIVQSVALRLDDDPTHPQPTGRSTGSLLETSPPPDAFKARVLSAHLDPADEHLLLNRFGVEYLKSVKELMTLRWLRTPEMTSSLQRHFPSSTRPVHDSAEEP